MALGKNLTAFDISKFDGGCNYSSDLGSLKGTESPNSMNVEFDGEIIRKRRGFNKLITTSTGTSDRGNSLFDFGVEGIGRKLIIHNNTKVYSSTNLAQSLTTIRTGAPNVRSSNSVIKLNLIQTYEDNSTPYYWDGSTATMTLLSGSAPGFKYTIEHNGYLLGMNTTSSRLIIYYEDINTMIGGAFIDYFTLSSSNRDDAGTGFFSLNGRVYASTKSGIFRISYIGGAAVFDFKQIVSSTGVVPYTAKVIITDEFGELCLFLGYDRRVYLFDGSTVRNVSSKFEEGSNDAEISLDQIDPNYLSNISAEYDTIKNVYRLFVTKLGNSTNTHCINVSTRNFAYYPFNNMEFHSSVIAQDNSGRRYYIAVGYDGYIRRLFHNINHDDGAAIIETYEGPPVLRKAGKMSKEHFIIFDFLPTANNTLLFEDRSDFDKTWKVRGRLALSDSRDRFLGVNTVLGTTAYLNSHYEVISQQISIPVVDNIYRFRIGSNGEDGDVCSYETGTVTGTAGSTSIVGTGTAWTSDMTAANGWKIWIPTGIHSGYLYDFTYVSPTTATITTINGTAPGDNIAGASYELYRSGYGACALGWELHKIELVSENLQYGKAESNR